MIFVKAGGGSFPNLIIPTDMGDWPPKSLAVCHLINVMPRSAGAELYL